MYNITQQIKTLALVPFVMLAFSSVKAQALPDADIKKNITQIPHPLNTLLQLKPVIFEYDRDKYGALGLAEGKQVGFLTDNIGQVLPGTVSTRLVSYMYGKNTYRNHTVKTVNQANLVPLLVASIQELNQQVEQLKTELKQLKGK